MNHLKRKWKSLSDLKSYIEKNTNEKVKYFNGMVLETNKGTYGLAFGEVSFKEKK